MFPLKKQPLISIIIYGPSCFAPHSLVISSTQLMSPSRTPLSLKECADMTDKGGGELSKQKRESLKRSL